MANGETLIIKVTADTNGFIQGFSGIQKTTDATAKKIKGLSSQVSEGLSSAFNLPTFSAAVLGATISGVAVKAVKDFASFENEILGVKTLLDESSFGAKGLEQGFKDMKTQMMNLGMRVPVDIGAMNKALFDTVSAGISASEAVGVVEISAKLATAGLTDVATATDGMTSALNAYGLSAGDAEVVASKFFIAQKAGKTTIAELSNGFGLVGSSAQAYGVSLDELLAATAAVTTAGVKTNSAYTGLNAVFAGIARPTSVAAEEAKRLGIEFNTTALRTLGLKGFLDQLTNAQGFTKTSVEKLFGSVEAQKIAFSLTGEQAKNFAVNLGTLSKEQETLNTLTAAYNTQSESTQNTLTLLANKFKVLSINIGEKLAPMLVTAVDYWGDFFKAADTGAEGSKKRIAEITEEIKKLEQVSTQQAKYLGNLADKSTKDKITLLQLEREEEQKKLDASVASEIAANDAKVEAQILKDEKLKELALAKDQSDLEARDIKAIAEKEFETQRQTALTLIDEEGEKNRLKNKVDYSNAKKIAEQQIEIEKRDALTKEEIQYQKDVIQSGENIAKAKAFFRSTEMQQTGELLDTIAMLTASNNKTLFRIGQIGSVARAFINTSEGITKALAQGGIFGPILAGAVAAAGAVQIANIRGQKMSGMAEGGLVTGGIPNRDSVPTMLMPGELVIPTKNFEKMKQSGELGGGGSTQILIGFKDNAFQLIEEKLLERRAIGVGAL